jgi:hypothetical protein
VKKAIAEVHDPFTGQVSYHKIPCIVFCGTEEDCYIVLAISQDPAKCSRFRGDLRKFPELREELFGANSKHRIVHQGPDGKPEVPQ